MIHIVLHAPEIPHNTGNIVRLCANAGASLHLVEPLGFAMDDKRLRRARLDYVDLAVVRHHASWGACREALHPARFVAVETSGSILLHDWKFLAGDVLVFGSETVGLPLAVLAEVPVLTLPMRSGARSLNLSNAVAIAVYEAWRQLGFAGAGDPRAEPGGFDYCAEPGTSVP